MSTIESRLDASGWLLPTPAAPAGNYVPALLTGGQVVTSGQLPFLDGAIPETGKVGAEVSEDEAVELAQIAVLNALAAVKAVIGDLDRVQRVVKLTVFVASAPSFTRQPAVADGASALLSEVFGEKGAHARSAVGVAVLPLDSPVELELTVAVDDAD